jgi:crotonobetainyl-CoA:carnitine CoA-transferase CaiB-like acyl-CoA transferase
MDALQGITVVDFTQVMLGPSATQMLGDFGADVIKVERPPLGDPIRRIFPDESDPSGFELDNSVFLAINRNKRSIVLDTRTEEGKAAVYRLVERADVVVSNFRPGVMDRMGFGWERLRDLNPRLIWASATGFGNAGPYRFKGAQDSIIQAVSGVMARYATGGGPLRINPTAMCDYTAGMHLVQGILLALVARERTGEGQKVEVSMYDSMLHAQMQEVVMQTRMGGEWDWTQMPLTGVFPTSDGAICVFGAFAPDPLRGFSLAFGLDEDLSQRDEFAHLTSEHRDELQAIFAEHLARDTTDHWVQRLEEHGILASPVRTLAETLEDEQTKVNGMLVDVEHPAVGPVTTIASPIHMSGTPATVRLPPPRLGEHGDEVLAELGVAVD